MADATGQASSEANRSCGQCARRISLVESIMKCRCGLVFCEKHRDPEKHDCSFDWKAAQRRKVEKENPQVVREGSSVSSEAAWCTEYEKHHPVARPSERRSQQLHGLASLLLVGLTVRGLLLTLVRGRLLLAPQQLVIGYLMGLAMCRLLPQALGYPVCSCRFCVFSWDVLTKPHWCVAADWESLKEHLIFGITAGKSNCLTQKLYNGPRTLPYIFHTVVARLRELSGGASCVA
eukprot:gnl/TRDRNA2_/TRDRNA2_158065_c0_seq1.p1 gnl/TRDRNA2_/TRDRNA2_158065_c0~~gnl/TRDRNA2_/TRDRNA2_158065_c0_seq1.p1  ORF type:complete len:234 (+),score=37.99 gnl/TRDRNA2_/TRDRNA2_158065_c0_seq1:63-764(+)